MLKDIIVDVFIDWAGEESVKKGTYNEKINRIVSEIKAEIKKVLPNAKKVNNCASDYNVGFNQCLTQVTNVIEWMA